jgi:hypothetical protein
MSSEESARGGWVFGAMWEKLVKIGAKVVSHARYVIFQMAEVMVLKALFLEILEHISRLRMVVSSPRAG